MVIHPTVQQPFGMYSGAVLYSVIPAFGTTVGTFIVSVPTVSYCTNCRIQSDNRQQSVVVQQVQHLVWYVLRQLYDRYT